MSAYIMHTGGDAMLIGDKIRLLRRNKGITQTQLAEALSAAGVDLVQLANS